MRQSIYAAKEELSLLYDITTKLIASQKQSPPTHHLVEDNIDRQNLIAPFILKNKPQTNNITLIKQLQESYVMKMKSIQEIHLKFKKYVNDLSLIAKKENEFFNGFVRGLKDQHIILQSREVKGKEVLFVDYGFGYAGSRFGEFGEALVNRSGLEDESVTLVCAHAKRHQDISFQLDIDGQLLCSTFLSEWESNHRPVQSNQTIQTLLQAQSNIFDAELHSHIERDASDASIQMQTTLTNDKISFTHQPRGTFIVSKSIPDHFVDDIQPAMMAVIAEFQLRKEHTSNRKVNILKCVSERIARPDIKFKLLKLIAKVIEGYPGANMTFKTDTNNITIRLLDSDIISVQINGFGFIFTDLEKNVDIECDHERIELLMINVIEGALEVWALRFFVGQSSMFFGDGGWMWYGDELHGKVGTIDTIISIESGGFIRLNGSKISFLSKIQSSSDILTGIILSINQA